MSAFAETYTPALSWQPLAWDSALFGFPAARLTTVPADLDRVLEECRDAGVRHLTARVDAGDLETVHALERAGFELLDGIQTFMTRPQPMPSGVVAVREFQPSDRAQVLAIARSAFVYDRFHADSSLTPEIADRVHEVWADNCCRGAMADVVFVAEEKNSILGFVTCRRTGVIGLVATHEAARRRGVARAITVAALAWFAANGAETVEVGTQLANIAAARLYQSLGFRPVTVSLTFRKLL